MLIKLKDLWVGQTVWDVVYGECAVVRIYGHSDEFEAQVLNCAIATTLRYNSHGGLVGISDNSGDYYECGIPEHRSLYFSKPHVNGSVVQPPPRWEPKYEKGDIIVAINKINGSSTILKISVETQTCVFGYEMLTDGTYYHLENAFKVSDHRFMRVYND